VRAKRRIDITEYLRRYNSEIFGACSGCLLLLGFVVEKNSVLCFSILCLLSAALCCICRNDLKRTERFAAAAWLFLVLGFAALLSPIDIAVRQSEHFDFRILPVVYDGRPSHELSKQRERGKVIILEESRTPIPTRYQIVFVTPSIK